MDGLRLVPPAMPTGQFDSAPPARNWTPEWLDPSGPKTPGTPGFGGAFSPADPVPSLSAPPGGLNLRPPGSGRSGDVGQSPVQDFASRLPLSTGTPPDAFSSASPGHGVANSDPALGLGQADALERAAVQRMPVGRIAVGDYDVGEIHVETGYAAPVASAAEPGQIGYGHRPLGVPVSQISRWSEAEAAAYVENRLNEYRNAANQAAKDKALDRALDSAYAWRVQGGGSAPFQRIMDAVAGDKQDSLTAQAVRGRAEAIVASGISGNIRALNDNGVNFGAQIHALQRAIDQNPDNAYGVISRTLSALRNSPDNAVTWIETGAFRQAMSGLGYGRELQDATAAYNAKQEGDQIAERAALARMSPEERRSYFAGLLLDAGVLYAVPGFVTTVAGAFAPGLRPIGGRAAAPRPAGVPPPLPTAEEAVISTDPFPTGTRPASGTGEPIGKWETVKENEKRPEQKVAIRLQNAALAALARAGYKVILQPTETRGRDGERLLNREQQKRLGLTPGTNPDAVIEGRVFDVYSPESQTGLGVHGGIQKKIEEGQAHRLVVNLGRTSVTREEVVRYLRDYPITDLKEVKIIDREGIITDYVPGRGTAP
jgi:hypothetical protein